MQEEWKPVVGFEGLYSVSNLGRVRSEERRKINPLCGTSLVKEKILALQTVYGYKKVLLTLNGVPNHKRVHRLVAEAFIPNPENKPQVNHIDNDRGNNKVDNLEWVTNKENSLHAHKQGRLYTLDPEIINKAKVLVEQGVNYTEIAERVGCSRISVYNYFPVKGYKNHERTDKKLPAKLHGGQ